MFWFRKRSGDDAAWYRHRNYKGNLTEDEKMELDSIRWQAKSGIHPAAKIDELPDEVIDYISDLENEALEYRKLPHEWAFIIAFCLFIYCILSGFELIKDIEYLPNIWILLLISIIFLANSFYNINKLDNLDFKSDKKLMEKWELDYIIFKRRSE
jgi:hypothetical protein